MIGGIKKDVYLGSIRSYLGPVEEDDDDDGAWLQALFNSDHFWLGVLQVSSV